MAKQEKAKTGVLPDSITQDKINAWKKEFNVQELKTFTITAKDGTKALVILKPLRDRNVLAMALAHATQSKIVEAGAVILENCKLYMDPVISSDDNMYVTACVLANQLNELAEGEMGNL